MSSASFSPDGTRIVTASDDNTARVWDSSSGRAIAALSGHEGRVESASFSPDGTRIVTASEDHTARVWDASPNTPDDRRAIATLSGHESEVTSAAFSPDPDGTRIVTASGDGTARVWDAGSGREIAALREREYTVTSAAFSPDGARIVTASEDNTARVWALDPIVFASAGEQVRMACDRLRAIGMINFSDADRQRFPILRDEPASPCPAARR